MNTTKQARPIRKDVTRNRALLLAAAEEVVATLGRDTTLDDVARHAGLGVATAYRHFETKTALLSALFEARLTNIHQLAAQAQQVDHSGEALFGFLIQLGERQARDRGLSDAISSGFADAVLKPALDRLIQITAEMIERARLDGHVRTDLAATDVPMIISILGGISDTAGESAPDLWRRYLDIVLDGISAESSPHRTLSVPAPTHNTIRQSLPDPAGEVAELTQGSLCVSLVIGCGEESQTESTTIALAECQQEPEPRQAVVGIHGELICTEVDRAEAERADETFYCGTALFRSGVGHVAA